VVAVAEPEFGQALLAWVVPKPGLAVDAPAIRQWLRLRLEPCKLPREIKYTPAIPRNALGKVDEPALRGLLADGPDPT
jgi:acyl-coenzyme A synthetase/AMP-(fatty) acid ligase